MSASAAAPDEHGRMAQIERVHPPKVVFAVLNPIMRAVVGSPLGRFVPILARLEFEGRRSGRRFRVVAGLHDIGGRRGVLTNSSWRHNFDGGREIDVVVGGTRRRAVATLQPDPATVAAVYEEKIAEIGIEGAQRRLGIRISGGTPSHDELVEFVASEGMSIVYLDVADG